MKRTLVLGSVWTASAAAAVGLGFLAISLVDAEASPATVPLAASSTSAAPSDDAPRPVSTTAPPPVQAEQGTVGGFVYASCEGGVPVLASAPAPGWWNDDSAQPGAVEFENGTQKVEVHVACTDAGPSFSVEGPRADDGSGSDSSSPPPSPGAPTDDSDGRTGGGHGSDDPPGDDSGGHGGGGHGSDG
jgi:hypothetical protein